MQCRQVGRTPGLLQALRRHELEHLGGLGYRLRAERGGREVLPHAGERQQEGEDGSVREGRLHRSTPAVRQQGRYQGHVFCRGASDHGRLGRRQEADQELLEEQGGRK